MKRTELVFDRPVSLAATAPPEHSGQARDQVRLMVSNSAGDHHHQFTDLKDYLQHGDLLVVNESATLPASLLASGDFGAFIVNLSTNYGHGLWVVEPRWDSDRPGPLPISPGDQIELAGLPARVVSPYPGIPRLWFIQIDQDINRIIYRCGAPIQYGYVTKKFPLSVYQTIFSRVPGSAEMPSAARPFTRAGLKSLRNKGIQLASLVLHTGVSSLEVENEEVETQPLYAEPFAVSQQTAAAVNNARFEGRKVIAVGTTVIRALESAWDGKQVQARRGFTRLYIHPGKQLNTVDGLLTGLHDPVTSHLAMLYALAGTHRIQNAYKEAVKKRYLWHEFGDSHLIFSKENGSRGH